MTVFIGGMLDGRHWPTPTGQKRYTALADTTQHYDLKRFKFDGVWFELYLLEGMTMLDVVRRLMAGYKVPHSPNTCPQCGNAKCRC